jgi:hypothetical protein
MRLDRRSGILAGALLSVIVIAGCGGDKKSPTTPTPPTTPTTPAPTNRNPVINGMTITPALAVSELSSITFDSSASDPDGDPVSYKWELNTNTPLTDTRQTFTIGRFTGSGSLTVKLTVSDGKGGTATQSKTLNVGSMTGTWRGTGQIIGTFTLTLSQTGGTITGSMTTILGPGQLDPAQPGTIDAEGNVQMRVKTSVYTDFNFRGRMDASGTRITGGMYGSGFNGETFTLVK